MARTPTPAPGVRDDLSRVLASELLSIARRYENVKTLSVYVPIPREAIDPAAHARIALSNGVAKAAEALGAASHVERAEFDACASRLAARVRESADPERGTMWIAFATATGDMYDFSAPGDLPSAVESIVAWDDGPRVAPFVALSAFTAGTIVLADHQRAVFFRVDEHGEMTELRRFETHGKIETGTHMGAPPKVSFHPGTHGTTATDSATRQATNAHTRHRARVVEELVALDPPGPVFVGGGFETAMHVVAALPPGLKERAVIARALHLTSTIPDMRRTVADLESADDANAQRALVEGVLGRARSTRLAVLGRGPVGVALAQRAVETLVLSAGALVTEGDAIERMVRDGLQQSAAVHIVRGGAGALLDAEAAGAAASLRFPLAAVSSAARA